MTSVGMADSCHERVLKHVRKESWWFGKFGLSDSIYHDDATHAFKRSLNNGHAGKRERKGGNKSKFS